MFSLRPKGIAHSALNAYTTDYRQSGAGMNQKLFPRVFFLFHLILAAVIFIQSVHTVRHAFGENDIHLGIFAAIEAIASVLFVIPKTIRIGAAMLLVIFAIAITIHGFGEGLPLLVYAAGVALVMTRGDSLGR
jgi:hypothetical protein